MRQGFSLVELSIVLVILGLLTGGILTGQHLIRAAELRSVTVDIQRYHTAAMAFREKYRMFPGDMNNAIDFWGAADADPATCYNTEGTGSQTCNGNGDGFISLNIFGEDDLRNSEGFRFWEHLANAGMIEGDYSGVGPAGAGWRDVAIPGENVPAMRIGGGVQAVSARMDNYGPVGQRWTGTGVTDVRTHMYVGEANSSGGPWSPLFSPEEMWGMDKKIDDGGAGTGRFTALHPRPECVDDTDVNTGQYVLTTTSVECVAIYFVEF